MTSTLKLAAFLVLGVLAMNVGALATAPKKPAFFARRDYTGLKTNYMQVADTNADGIPDLIVNAGNNIEVEFGNGNGTFRRGPNTSLPVGGSRGTFVATDVNSDGKIDLVLVLTAASNGRGVMVFLGNGDGTFRPAVPNMIEDAIHFLVVGDFNGDGVPDIAASGSEGAWLLTGKGDGTFNSAVQVISLPGSVNIAAADFNQDGKLDLVVTQAGFSPGYFVVLFGNGNGTFQPPQTFSTPARPFAVAVGSLTKGGPASIAVNGRGSDEVYVYLGNGAGGFSSPSQVNLPSFASLAIGDVNGDGIPDLVSDEGYVAYGEGSGTFTKSVGYPITGTGEASNGHSINAVLADLRNNGRKDIVVGSYDIVSVLLNLGSGLFEDGIWTGVTGGAGCGAKADFNRDGKPDLAVNNANGVSVLFGSGYALAPFKAGTNIPLAGAGCLVSGDLNDDGVPDLLVPTSSSIAAYLGNGDGTFTLKGETPAPTESLLGQPEFVVVGDFNHDGKLDFATNANLLALGNGDGTFQAPTSLMSNSNCGAYCSGIAVGDIDNDGWLDLVLTPYPYPGSGVTVLLNNHHGGFTEAPTYFGADTIRLVLADLNSDGNMDLVLLNTAGGAADIYLGNGQGGFTLQETLAGPLWYEPYVSGLALVADVNGDGIPDILLSGSGTISVYLGEGGATFAAPFSIGTGPSPGSILTENLHGQSPKAGIPDIVAPDTSGGVMVLLNLTP